MLQYGAGKRFDIVCRRSESSLDQRLCANRQHEGLARPRPGPPGDHLAKFFRTTFIRPCRTHQPQDRVDDLLAHRQAPHQMLRFDKIIRRADRLRGRFLSEGRGDNHAPLGIFIWIVDIDLQKKTVELRFGQRIGAFMLQRILRSQHMEWRGQIMALPRYGDITFLHRLQQGRLRPRAGAVDFIRHQQLREHRTPNESEGAAAAFALLQHFRANDIGRHKIRGELDALPVHAEHNAKRFDEAGFRKARYANQQSVSAGQQRDQCLVDHFALPQNNAAHRFADAPESVRDSPRSCYGLFLVPAIDGFCFRHQLVHMCAANAILRCRLAGSRLFCKSMRRVAFMAFRRVAAQPKGLLRRTSAPHNAVRADYVTVMPEHQLGLASLQRELAVGRKLPPVEKWTPAHCGEIDIRIGRDGSWFHQGTPIGRPELVRLFSTILRKEADAFYLVTPAEKMRIRVDDAPFMAVLLEVGGAGRDQRLQFTTNVGDAVIADGEHCIRVEFARETEEPAPYLHVRSGLEARINRSVFYQMADIAVPGEGNLADRLGVWSEGRFFPLESPP